MESNLQEPVYIKAQGQPVAVLLPIEIYESLKRAEAELAKLKLVAAVGQAGLDRERAAYERLKPQLLQKYPGKYVAIVGGEVADVDDDDITLSERVHERYANIPMYIQLVTEHPRIYSMPYRKVIRK